MAINDTNLYNRVCLLLLSRPFVMLQASVDILDSLPLYSVGRVINWMEWSSECLLCLLLDITAYSDSLYDFVLTKILL